LQEGFTCNIEIFSLTGQKVFENSVTQVNNTLDLSDLDSGIYIMQTSSDGNIYTQKIIIQ